MVARRAERRFDPQPGAWRSFEMTTAIELPDLPGPAKVWVPLPVIDSDYQRWSVVASTLRFRRSKNSLSPLTR